MSHFRPSPSPDRKSGALLFCHLTPLNLCSLCYTHVLSHMCLATRLQLLSSLSPRHDMNAINPANRLHVTAFTCRNYAAHNHISTTSIGHSLPHSPLPCRKADNSGMILQRAQSQLDTQTGQENWTRTEHATRTDTKLEHEKCTKKTSNTYKTRVQMSCQNFVSNFRVQSTRNDLRRRVIVLCCGGGVCVEWKRECRFSKFPCE